MLSLEPPFYDLGGVLVYRDHAVPTQFYYTAPPPQISRTAGRPMFDLLMYRVALAHSPLSGTKIPDELGAGFLTMGVDCALSDARRADVLRGLEERTGIPEAQIALYPVPYHRGGVSVLALDRYTTPGDAAGDPGTPARLDGRPTFVESVLGSAKPMLLGDLRAIFSLGLSEEGVAFLAGLYADRAAPVGVVYDLAFYGLRPAVEARITANLSRVYEHFGGTLTAQYQWAKAEIEKGVDHLVESSAITVELTSQATGEAAQKSRDLALSLFKERIVQELFRPTAPPPDPTAALGGVLHAAPKVGVGLTLKMKTTEELKTVTYDFRERSPEERVHAPQGFLPLLLGKAELERRIHRIDLQNAFFETLQVLVSGPTPAEFAALGIRQVEATLTYGEAGDAAPPESQTLLFRPDATGDKTFAAPRRGRASLGYTAAVAYEFTRQAGTDGDGFRYEIAPRPRTGRTVQINPYEDFGVLDVEVEPGRLHADVRAVDVHLAYRAPHGDYGADEHFRLLPGDADPTPARRHWQVRTRETALAPYTVTSTFTFADGGVYEAAPFTATDPLLRVDSPFRQDRRLLIRPNVTAPQITQITVELEYADAPNRYTRRSLVTLDPPFAAREVTWPLLDPNRQAVRYRATTYEQGFITEGEWQETTDPSVVVGSVGSRVATVQVRLIGPPLAEVQVDAVQLKLEVATGATTWGDGATLLLEGAQPNQDVKLPLPPGASLRYRYQTTAFKANGQATPSPWKEMTTPLLVLSTRSL